MLTISSPPVRTDEPISQLLNEMVAVLSHRVWPEGFEISTERAPSSFIGLKREFEARGRVTISSVNSADTIYGDPEINIMARAWHDWAHLKLNADFSFEGETRAFRLQCVQLISLVGKVEGMRLAKILEAEIIGQFLHHRQHKAYVGRQRGFVKAYLADATTALGEKW